MLNPDTLHMRPAERRALGVEVADLIEKRIREANPGDDKRRPICNGCYAAVLVWATVTLDERFAFVSGAFDTWPEVVRSWRAVWSVWLQTFHGNPEADAEMTTLDVVHRMTGEG